MPMMKKTMTKKPVMMLMLGVSAVVLMAGGAYITQHQAAARQHPMDSIGVEPARIEPAAGKIGPGYAGDFLASYHAQSQYDWKSANEYLERVLAQDPENPELIRRSMVLAMGAGDLSVAAERARKLLTVLPNDPSNALGIMILCVDEVKKGNLDAARAQMEKMPKGDMTDFISPIINSWIKAGQGTYDVSGFNPTTVHLYHAAMMAVMLNKMDQARVHVDKIAATEGLSLMEAERVADIYAAIGDRATALDIYKKLVAERANDALEEKITALSHEGSDLSGILRPLQVKTAAQGVALAMYDMANILYNDKTESSTKLFAQMALSLDPELIEARLLLADSLARNGRIDEAIGYFREIPKTHKAYLPAQRYAADLLAEAKQNEAARKILADLFTQYNDVESLIRIADLYRAEENYKDALSWYNKAADKLGKKIPEDYWYLLYGRGMAYERQGDWQRAESDLKAALIYRPDHPYLLNYLGYGWADQGLHLDEALKMIERAVALRPSDGYITDSLGWVYYMMGNYKESIPYLERAVELLPYDSTINDHLGDAYWQVGRKNEARFQWERAFNYAEDESLKATLANKLAHGPDLSQNPPRAVRAAGSDQ